MKRILLTLGLLIPIGANAALNKVTHHSRANCFGFNESVSWDASQAHYFAVTSQHYSGYNLKHSIPYNPAYTHRAAAYCKDSKEDIVDEIDNVIGLHAISNDDYSWQEETTNADTCKIYEGWYEISGDILDPPVNEWPTSNGSSSTDEVGHIETTDITGIVDFAIAVIIAIWSWLFN